MKKKLKGFTLVECIVAMAIIGVASVMMAQIYAGIAKINRDNAAANRTLNEEMKYVEQMLTKDGDNISCTLLTNYTSSAADEGLETGVTYSQSNFDFKIKPANSNPMFDAKFSGVNPDKNAEIGIVIYKVKSASDRADKSQYEEDIIRYKFIRPNPDTYK